MVGEIHSTHNTKVWFLQTVLSSNSTPQNVRMLIQTQSVTNPAELGATGQ